jgi:hypothetical protein
MGRPRLTQLASDTGAERLPQLARGTDYFSTSTTYRRIVF